KLLCDLRFIEARAGRGFIYQLVADYDLALDAWPGYERYDPLERPAPAPLPGWLPATTAAVLAGVTVAHPGAGAGPGLAALRSLPESQRTPGPQPPRCGPGQAIPAAPFGPDQGVMATMAQMAATEKAAGGGAAAAAATPAERVQAFANFVRTHSHMLAAIPRETLTMARNHAGTGGVADQAQALTPRRTQRWR